MNHSRPARRSVTAATLLPRSRGIAHNRASQRCRGGFHRSRKTSPILMRACAPQCVQPAQPVPAWQWCRPRSEADAVHRATSPCIHPNHQLGRYSPPTDPSHIPPAQRPVRYVLVSASCGAARAHGRCRVYRCRSRARKQSRESSWPASKRAAFLTCWTWPLQPPHAA